MTACRCSACKSNPALAKRVAGQRAAAPTGDHIRRRLAETLMGLWAADLGEPVEALHEAPDELAEALDSYLAVLEPTVRDLIADELDVVVHEFRARFGSGGGYGKELQARAAAVRTRTEETT